MSLHYFTVGSSTSYCQLTLLSCLLSLVAYFIWSVGSTARLPRTPRTPRSAAAWYFDEQGEYISTYVQVHSSDLSRLMPLESVPDLRLPTPCSLSPASLESHTPPSLIFKTLHSIQRRHCQSHAKVQLSTKPSPHLHSSSFPATTLVPLETVTDHTPAPFYSSRYSWSYE